MTLWEGILCFVTGTAVGAVYFGGLWHTVRLLKTTKRATRVLLVSWLLRNLFFVSAFFIMMQSSVQRLIAGFLGMMAVRIVMSAYMKRKNAAVSNGGRV